MISFLGFSDNSHIHELMFINLSRLTNIACKYEQS